MNNSTRLYSSLFVLSVATLTLEVLQLRVFAYSLLRSLAHIVVSIVLLGIGVGSVTTALSSRFNEIKEEKLLSFLFMGFSVSVLLTHSVFNYFFEWINQGYNFPRLWLFSILFSVPYVFFGMALTYIFKKYVNEVPKLYSINLIGSGLGCVIPLIALYPLGAEKLIFIVAVLGALCAMLYLPSFSKKAAAFSAIYVVLLLIGSQHAEDLMALKSKPNGGLAKMRTATPAKQEFSKWDPLGRIEVYSFDNEYAYMFMPKPVSIKAMFQDGDAGSMLVNIDKTKHDYTHFFNGSIFSLVYQLKERPNTLAIGLGGGHDVMRAYHFNSSRVTGVEINATTVSLVKEVFRDFLDDPYGRDNVNIVNMDGRYFVRDKVNEYDIVQIAGADTDTSNLTSGALSVSENYLYTAEAFRDYFRALKPDGVLSLIRFGEREPMLILTTAITAMKEMGITDIHKKIMVVKQAINYNVIMKKVPFTQEEVRAIELFTHRINESSKNLRLPANDVIGYEAINEPELMYMPRPDWSGENAFTGLVSSVGTDSMDEFISSFPSNIAPLSDNMPFFFQYEKPENIFKYRNSVIYNLFISIAQIVAFSLVLIFLPVYIMKRKQTSIRYNFRYMLYFLGVGIGFMLIELGLIQKSVLFLGHPTYSFVAVVFSILLFSGLGSLASGYIRATDRRIVLMSITAVIGLTLLYLFFMDDMLSAMLPQSTSLRMVVLGLFFAPIGFAMGMPTPKGLQLLSASDRNFIPVAMAVNSVASVLAAASSLPFAMLYGFTTIFLTALAAYGLSLAAVAVRR